MFAKSFLASGLLLTAGATAITPSGTVPSSSQTTSMAGPDGNLVSVQVVKVSDMNATLKYYPEEIQAEPGSLVQFQFYPKVRLKFTLIYKKSTDLFMKNHTVTQSTFDRPCEPINSVMSNVTGINSGPMPPENGMMKVFTIMVNDTKPIWMYCATKPHCQKGMVMAINAPQEGEKTLASYKAAAIGTADNSTSANGTNTTASGNPPSGSTSAGTSSFIVHSTVASTGIAAFLMAAFAWVL